MDGDEKLFYCIAGHFQRVQISLMVTFCGSIFVDTHDRAVTSMYKCTYFSGLIFTVHESTVEKNSENWTSQKFPAIPNLYTFNIIEGQRQWYTRVQTT